MYSCRAEHWPRGRAVRERADPGRKERREAAVRQGAVAVGAGGAFLTARSPFPPWPRSEAFPTPGPRWKRLLCVGCGQSCSLGSAGTGTVVRVLQSSPREPQGNCC